MLTTHPRTLRGFEITQADSTLYIWENTRRVFEITQANSTLYIWKNREHSKRSNQAAEAWLGSLELFTQTRRSPSSNKMKPIPLTVLGPGPLRQVSAVAPFLSRLSYHVSWSGAASSSQSLAQTGSTRSSGTRRQQKLWKSETGSASEPRASPLLRVGESIRWVPVCLRHFRLHGEARRAED